MEVKYRKSCLILLLSTLAIVEGATNNISAFGFVEGLSGDSNVDACAAFVVPDQPLPPDAEHAAAYPLRDWTADIAGCSLLYNLSKEHLAENAPAESRIVAVNYRNCSAVDAAKLVQDLGAQGLLLVASSTSMPLPSVKDMRNAGVKIPTGIITSKAFYKLKTLGERISVKEYAPPRIFYMDFATLIIWLLSVGSLILGTLWDQYIHFPLNGGDEQVDYDVNEKGTTDDNKNKSEDKEAIKKEESTENAMSRNKKLGFSIIKMTVFIIIMTVIQILLYFFYDVAIYVVYAIFFLITMPPTYMLFGTFRRFMPCFSYEINCGKKAVEVRSLILFLLAVSLFIIWVVFRKESFSWVLQDLLVLFTIIRMTSKVHLYDLRVCVVALVLLTLYFTFIIFGTASILPEGKSILEIVIAGRGGPEANVGRERLPMTIRIPQLSMDPLSACFHRESAVSLVDVIVPGGVIYYCYEFGSKVGARFPYFLSSITGFGLGLGLTFAVQTATRHPQASLLFVSPCILILVIGLSIFRKEFNEFWNGQPEAKSPRRKQYEQVAQNETNL